MSNIELAAMFARAGPAVFAASDDAASVANANRFFFSP